MVAKKKSKPTGKWSRVRWVVVGADISTYSISLGGMALLSDGKIRSAKAVRLGWEKDTDYFERMKDAANAQNPMHDLFSALRLEPELAQVFIAVEEAVSFGHLQRHASNSAKQQLQISGAFLGGLLRYGWKNIYEIQANQWRKVIADDLGITIHKTKWSPGGEGKFRAREWVEKFHPKWDGHWPDMIRTQRGLITKPEASKAKAQQSDDRYEALAAMWWMRQQMKELPF